MSGIKDLSVLLQQMSPQLSRNEYVFCTVKGDCIDYKKIEPLATYKEEEGLTLVLNKVDADTENFTYQSVFKAITLRVHSSLDAVGLTAAVSTKLAQNNISANIIAAYYHDHIFVHEEKAELALKLLKEFNS